MSRRRRRKERFPWARAGLLVFAVWLSLWAAGLAGARVGEKIYNERYAEAAPYTAEELESLDNMAAAAAAAEREMHIWRESVKLGGSVASVEGAMFGTILLLAIWVTGGMIWLWMRERQRQIEAQWEEFGYEYEGA